MDVASTGQPSGALLGVATAAVPLRRTALQDPIDVLRSKELDRGDGFSDQTEKRISVFLVVLKRGIDREHLRCRRGKGGHLTSHLIKRHGPGNAVSLVILKGLQEIAFAA
jgi:hypothetical protein